MERTVYLEMGIMESDSQNCDINDANNNNNDTFIMDEDDSCGAWKEATMIPAETSLSSMMMDEDDTNESDGANSSSNTTGSVFDVIPYKKNLRYEFENAQQHPRSKLATTTTTTTDPTPSKAPVAVKIARLEERVLRQQQKQQQKQNPSQQQQSIQVYLRLRPSVDGTNTTEVLNETTLRTRVPPPSRAVSNSNNHNTASMMAASTIKKEYQFTAIFPETTPQETMYRALIQPPLKRFLERGEPCLVFCYGNTNSGKTYTVTGNPRDSVTAGLVPRTLSTLIQQYYGNSSNRECEKRPTHEKNKDADTGVHTNRNHVLTLSYFEVYNENIFDLLCEENHHHHLKMKQSLYADSGIDLKQVRQVPIRTQEEGLKYLDAAQRARKTANNAINSVSSRSHAIIRFSYQINKDENNNKKDSTTTADFWIVDLAGSERNKRTGGGRAQKDAVHINKSLMTLNRCLLALRHNQQPPYRESKLTTIFGNHWNQNHNITNHSNNHRNTIMIVNVNPSVSDWEETQHVLGYASTAKTIVLRDTSQANTLTAQHPATAVQYGYNGHKIRNNTTTSAASSKSYGSGMLQTIKNVVKKLSPKRDIKRKIPSGTAAVAAIETTLLEKVDHDSNKRLRMSPLDIDTTVEQQQMIQKNIRAAENVHELLDTIAECEDEMERMREQHIADLTQHKEKYEQIVAEHMRTMQQQQENIQELEDELCQAKANDATSKVKELESELAAVTESMSQALLVKQDRVIELEGHVNELEGLLESANEEKQKELLPQIKNLQAELLKMQSLVQQLMGEKEKNSIVQENPENGARRILASISVNRRNESQLHREDDSGSSLDDQEPKWLKPRRKVIQDPITGIYLRPRGRQPDGVEGWDEVVGAWRLISSNEDSNCGTENEQ